MKMLSVLIIMLSTFTYLTAAAPKTSVGTLEFRIGSIQIKGIGAKKWTSIDEGDKISTGDTLKVGDESKCEIKLTEGTQIRFPQNSLFVFNNYDAKKGTVKAVFTQLKGVSWTSVNKKDGKKKDFKVKSLVAVAAVVGTAFKFGYDGNLTEVSVMEGQVNVDLEQEKKEELNIPEPDKTTGSQTPAQSSGPKEIPGPFEVTLSQWIAIVKGEVISIRQDGKFSKSKTSVEELENEWESLAK